MDTSANYIHVNNAQVGKAYIYIGYQGLTSQKLGSGAFLGKLISMRVAGSSGTGNQEPFFEMVFDHWRGNMDWDESLKPLEIKECWT